MMTSKKYLKYSTRSVNNLIDALTNLKLEDYIIKGHNVCIDPNTVVESIGFDLLDEYGKIISTYPTEPTQPSAFGHSNTMREITITEIIAKYLNPSKNVNCLHFCSDGRVHIENINGNRQIEKTEITVEKLIEQFLTLKSTEEIKTITAVCNSHIETAKNMKQATLNEENIEWRKELYEKDIEKYISFAPIYYYTSYHKRVLLVLTLKQSKYYSKIRRSEYGDCQLHEPVMKKNMLKLKEYFQIALWSLLQERLSYEKEKSINESLKSAKAAIMSRNMSHNLGSHVMFYIKQKLQSVSKIVDNKVLYNIIPEKNLDVAAIEKDLKANKSIELPFLVGLGRFINYLQERQDYIATIATDYIPARTTISFKDFVYDELKPDLRYIRHHSAEDDAEWKSGNLLLDYIAYSEGYRSCNDIEILFEKFDGKNSHLDDFQTLRRFNIAVPGGVIGRQALFSIFENIIRNAAKHSDHRSDNKLTLQLSLLDINKDEAIFKSTNFISKLHDNDEKKPTSIDNLYDLYKKNSNKYHILRIKVDMPNDANIAEELPNKLAEPYLDENGVMIETTKGLKEMRISAAWLRGYSIDTEINISEDPPAISVYSENYEKTSNEKGQTVTISYILCIRKPCRVAFITSKKKQHDLLLPYGCKVFNQYDIDDKNEANYKTINEIADYEIVCMPEDLKKKLCPYISSRYLAIDEKEINIRLERLVASIKKGEINKIEDCIGSIYEYEKWGNSDIPKLVIADEQANKSSKKTVYLHNDKKVILTETGCVQEADVNGAVVYSTHFKGLASKSVDPNDYHTWLQKAICIESVTGNNSTARLIRQDEWTREWKAKTLSAGIARVAIFDERIFNSFISRESKSRRDGLCIDLIHNIWNKTTDPNIFSSTLQTEYGITPSDAANLIKSLKSNQKEKISIFLKKYAAVKYTHDIAQKNHERRIWAFDIKIPKKEDNTTKVIEIIGYNVRIGEHIGEYVQHESDAVITIAKLTQTSKDGEYVYNIDLCDNNKVFNNRQSSIFDYITIHQGVLDKIYTEFCIKDNKIATNTAEKQKVTNMLHKCFSRYDTPSLYSDFLPNFIIHSGRSRPSEEDMPQHQPFIQFAAVDHAVKDCKYTLVELLATAHYDKSNNNN